MGVDVNRRTGPEDKNFASIGIVPYPGRMIRPPGRTLTFVPLLPPRRSVAGPHEIPISAWSSEASNTLILLLLAKLAHPKFSWPLCRATASHYRKLTR